MVVLHVKRGEESLFLYETTTTVDVSVLTQKLVQIQNDRLKIGRLADALLDLSEYGPFKPYHLHGYTEEQLDELATKNGEFQTKKEVRDGVEITIKPDPTGKRTGEVPAPPAVETLQKTANEAKKLISKDQVTANRLLVEKELFECIENIKAAITIAFGNNLPEYDPAFEIINGQEELEGTAAGKEVLIPEETCLWWANKEFLPGKKLFDYIGKNEKTKILVKFQRKGMGAPVREAPLGEQEQKNLMAYYFKKQEEEKKLLENDDDDYLNSPWANNKALKSAFTGVRNVSWRPQ